MRKYLVLGASGLIGRAVGRQLEGKYEWFGTYFRRKEPGLINVDITSVDNLKEMFDEVKPDYVINCANLAGGVDFCESHPDLARKFHLEANIPIGELCEKYGARMVLMSTDYVFDGEKCEEVVSFTPVRAGESQKVEFLLYKNGENEPCLKPLHLWVNVKE